MSAKRGPGRPLTPGNTPGANGNPQLRLRLPPLLHAEMERRGGATWARDLLVRELGTCTGCRCTYTPGQLQEGLCPTCR